MTEQSEAMMNLLKELALLKELDDSSQADPQSEESRSRLTRRQEITAQIRELGEAAS